jgi:O-antigen ligase
MLTAIFNPSGQAHRRSSVLRTLLFDLCSFELMFLLFLYSNVFQFVLPPLPIDTTIVFLALSVAMGGIVVLREGVYVRGLVLVGAFIPYLLWLPLSATWSPSRILKVGYLETMFTVNLWCLIATAMIIGHKRERMVRFLKYMVVLSLLVAVIGVVIYFRYGSFKFAGWEDGRAYNQWGRAVVNGAVVLLFLFLRSRHFSLRQVVTGALLGLCTFFVFVASSRSALLSLVTPCLPLFAVMIVPRGADGLRISHVAVLLPLLMAAVLILVSALIASGYRIDTIARLQTILAQAEDVEIVQGPNRWDYYAEAIRQIIQSPIIGNGVRSFAVIYRQAELSGSHPHNIVLEVFSDTGVIGLILFLLFFYVAIRPLRPQRLRTDPMMLLVAMLFVSRLTAAMFGADLSNQQELFVFVGMLSLVPMRPPQPVDARTAGRGETMRSQGPQFRRTPAAT